MFAVASVVCEFDFDLKLIRVDYTTAQFEISDDNATAHNYMIGYELSSVMHYIDKAKVPIWDKTTSSSTIQLQTNTLRLIEQAAALNHTMMNATDENDVWDNGGEYFSPSEVNRLKSETTAEQHRFKIDSLSENRFYEIKFRVSVKQAYLKLNKVDSTTDRSKSISKLFYFKFKTQFDVNKAAIQACHSALTLPINESCYKADSNCTVCASHCYQVKGDNVDPNGPVLCQQCPCESKKSTGECDNSGPDTDPTENRNLKCKQCLKPYTGQFCTECLNEGVDYFKNELGECVKCDCNHNSAYDFKSNNRKRKCEEITGLLLRKNLFSSLRNKKIYQII